MTKQIHCRVYIACLSVLCILKPVHNQYCYSCNCCQSSGQCNPCSECYPGYYGQYCFYPCPSTCLSIECDKSTGDCTACTTGYYGYKCQTSCSSRCVNGECDKSTGDCTACTTGYYGYNCQSSCSSRCVSGECDKSTGDCLACTTGYHGYKCQSSCSNSCYNRKCDKSTGYCTACTTGYYGSNCQSSCSSRCLSGVCDKSTGDCIACTTGYYGYKCQTSCLNRCLNGECNKSTGACIYCTTGYYGAYCQSSCETNCVSCTTQYQCTACKPGYYGTYCENSCSSLCVNKKCRKNSGVCYNTCAVHCKSCTSLNSCTECDPGYYGLDCRNTCSHECINGECNSSNGSCERCPTACASCTSSSVCTACISGRYGPVCNQNCPDSCLSCNSDSMCSSCQPGFYGTACDKHCPANCKDNQCVKETGICTVCYQGDSKCKECTLDNGVFVACSKCEDGYFPAESDKVCTQCPNTCLNGRCSPQTGECLDGCFERTWGDMCEKTCSTNRCLICNRKNGDCEVCEARKYSQDCSMECSDSCNKTDEQVLCAISDGACLNGCTSNTVYGKTCGKSCSVHCLDKECDWKSGICRRGCVSNKYGPVCEFDCGVNCLTDITNFTRCFDKNGTGVSGCQPGYYGSMCEMNCSSNCKNVTCEISSGECHHGCNGDFTDRACVQALEATYTSNGGVIGGAVGGVVAVILAVVIVVAVLCFIRRRRNNNHPYDYANDVNRNKAETSDLGTLYNNTLESVNIYSIPTTDMTDAALTNLANPNYELPPEQMRMSSLSTLSNEELEEEELDFLPPKVIPMVDRTYANVVRRIQVKKLADYVAKKKTADFEEEFQDFKHGLQEDISYAESQKTHNMAKNRYKCIYPYDDHRVKLTGAGTDYINASYIDGFNKQNEYIACLGPTEKTNEKFVNFWMMVWQQKVEKIAMVTNLFENGGHKCDQYWPDTGTSVSYGDVTVTCHSEDVYADYTVRSFTVSQKSQDRSLHHIHFTAWPDKGVPDDVTSLIEFRQKVKSTQTALKGHIIVHCSAGVGRTGTYIALDILTNEGEAQKTVDIFGCVEHMREHRVNMVQTAKQYEYLHNAVVHSLTFECQAIPGDKFQQFFSSLSDSDLQKMFERFHTTAEQETQGEKEAVQKHKTLTKLNRAGANVPGDRHRPKLYLHRKPGSSDYINAVYLNSFRSKDRYIVAQTPLPETVLDFICLVYQTNCKCIVSMEPVEALKGKKVGKYFPADNQTLKLEPFQITSVIEESTPQYQLRKLTIAHTGPVGSSERAIRHFQFTQWKEKQSVPMDPTAMLQLVKDVDTKANKPEDEGPIIIHCLNGGEKSGLFCAVSVLIQKMAIEHEVSVVNTVRMVKSRRAFAIPDKDQYSFCYQCVSAYLQSFDIYSNFSLRI